MTVRSHQPWPLRVLVLIAAAVVVFAAGYWIYEQGRSFGGFGKDLHAELARLREQNAALSVEHDRLEKGEADALSRLNIEQSAQQQLGNQIRSLELENARLKDDVAFFENLSANGPQNGLEIKRLQVGNDLIPQQMRYRLLVTQGGKNDHDFNGQLQLLVTLQHDGKTDIMNLPDGAAGAASKPFQVNFRYFERIEGTFTIPPGATVKQVEARILEKGAVRAQQTVMLG